MQIDFHVLENANQQQAWLYVCKLVEKIHATEQTIYIHSQSQSDAEKLDTLLWTYCDDSFLPHSIYSPAKSHSAPILIGCQEDSAPKHTVLINLSEQVPLFYQQFSCMTEIVFSQPTVQQLARERFRHYRDQQHHINTIKINAGEA